MCQWQLPVADLYSDTTLEGHQFCNTANQPWTVNDPATGKQLGLVSGMAQVRVAVPKQPGDGGYGSVAEMLLIAVKAEGQIEDFTLTHKFAPGAESIHACKHHSHVCCGTALSLRLHVYRMCWYTVPQNLQHC